jgi:hypothetical protein
MNVYGSEADGRLDMLALVEASWRADGSEQALIKTYPDELREWIYGATVIARLALQAAEGYGCDVAKLVAHWRADGIREREH